MQRLYRPTESLLGLCSTLSVAAGAPARAVTRLATPQRCLSHAASSTRSARNRVGSRSVPQCIAPQRLYSSLPTGSPGENINEKANYQRLTWRALALFGVTAVALVAYFKSEKDRMDKERATNPVKPAQTGKPLVGGPFSLVNQDGIPVTDLDFKGRWMLVYFGFTHCPDICPEELERMALVIDNLEKQPAVGPDAVTPIFISCDPKRDSVEAVRMYVKEFHPKLIGLTGTYDQVKSAAKAYRLYFSAPPRALDDDETDYLVDHSIFFYLMDPEGRYARHYGKIDTVERITEDTTRIVSEYKAAKGIK